MHSKADFVRSAPLDSVVLDKFSTQQKENSVFAASVSASSSV